MGAHAPFGSVWGPTRVSLDGGVKASFCRIVAEVSRNAKRYA